MTGGPLSDSLLTRFRLTDFFSSGLYACAVEAHTMSKALSLVRLPAQTAIHRFGSPAHASRSSALLRFDQGLTIPRDGQQGWAIVGDGEGRRLAVEVSRTRAL